MWKYFIRFLYYLIFIPFLLCVFLGLAYLFLPVDDYLKNFIQTKLEEKNIPVSHFDIKSVDLEGITFGNIELKSSPPIKLNELKIAYDLDVLQQKRVHDLTIVGITHMIDTTKKTRKSKTEIPVEGKIFDQLPLDNIYLKNITVKAKGPNWTFNFPFSADLDLQNRPTMKLKGSNASLKIGKETYFFLQNYGQLKLYADQKKWKGQLKAILIPKSKSALFKKLFLQAQTTILKNKLYLNLTVKDEHKKTILKTTYSYGLNSKKHSLNKTIFYWKEGTISLSPVAFSDMKSVRFQAKIKNMVLPKILAHFKQKEIKATGILEGDLELGIEKGSFFIGDGLLKSIEQGNLVIAPSYLNSIAQNNPQLQDVAKAFTDFDYNELELIFKKQKIGETSIHLKVKGHNKTVYSGRPIHLNMNIGGEWLSAITHGLKLYKLPEKLFERN